MFDINSLSDHDRLLLVMALSDLQPELIESQLADVQEILDKQSTCGDVSLETWQSLMQVLGQSKQQSPTDPFEVGEVN